MIWLVWLLVWLLVSIPAASFIARSTRRAWRKNRLNGASVLWWPWRKAIEIGWESAASRTEKTPCTKKAP